MKNEITQIQEKLFSLRDAAYADFQQKLIPTVSKEAVIGVRIPVLRKYAKSLQNTQAAELFLQALPHTYYDENNLHAALLDGIKNFDTALSAVNNFLPYIDNWATCDLFCPKALKSKPTRLWEEIQVWLASDAPYTVRYALVRLTGMYLDTPLFFPDVLKSAAAVQSDDYYVLMAQAWFFSMALVKQYQTALPYITEKKLPTWVHNKAIQKATESYRTPQDVKEYLKTLRCKQP